MTEEPDVTRQEFEALKARVAELENSGEPDTDTPAGLDHRDMNVLGVMERTGVKSGVQLVRTYLSATDITNKKTAKNRAKMLERHEKYKELAP